MRSNSLTDAIMSTVNARIWRWVEQHGGASKVANELGVVRQTLYNIRDNRSFPSAGTLALIKQKYPYTNMNQFLSDDESTPTVIDVDIDELARKASKADEMEARLRMLEDRNTTLQSKLFEALHPDFFRDKEGVKIGADRSVTDYLFIPHVFNYGRL